MKKVNNYGENIKENTNLKINKKSEAKKCFIFLVAKTYSIFC